MLVALARLSAPLPVHGLALETLHLTASAGLVRGTFRSGGALGARLSRWLAGRSLLRRRIHRIPTAIVVLLPARTRILVDVTVMAGIHVSA